MKKLKILTIVGTRPEIIRLSRVISVLDKYVDHVLVHTGQNYDYELNKIFFDDLEIRAPDFFLECASSSSANTIGKVISETDNILLKENPDAVLILGDTNSCLSAIAAKKRSIPIFHMEAGNRCFDERVPEETNRKIVDHIADINLTYSSISREYLLREGKKPDTVIKTGSPMFEVITHYQDKINNSDILQRLNLKDKNYFLVSAHREENLEISENFRKLVSSLNAVASRYKKKIIFSTHPRTKAKINELAPKLNKQIELLKPLNFSDYNHLQLKAITTLSDSGTISEESSILNFPALNIRMCHERPESFEEAPLIMSGLEKESILQGIEIVKNQSRDSRDFRMVRDYSAKNVSKKVLRIIMSYTPFVRHYLLRTS